MRTRGLCELTLESRNHRTLAQFYREALDLPVLAEQDDRVWLACCPASRLGLWSVGEKEFGDRGGRHVHFAFSVPHDELEHCPSSTAARRRDPRTGRARRRRPVPVLRRSRRQPRRGMGLLRRRRRRPSGRRGPALSRAGRNRGRLPPHRRRRTR